MKDSFKFKLHNKNTAFIVLRVLNSFKTNSTIIKKDNI